MRRHRGVLVSSSCRDRYQPGVFSKIDGRTRVDSIEGGRNVGGGVGHLAEANGMRPRSGPALAGRDLFSTA